MATSPHRAPKTGGTPAIAVTPAIWQAAMEAIREEVGAQSFDAWLVSASPEDYDPETRVLSVQLPNDFYRRWVEKRYRDAMARAFSGAMGVPLSIEFTIAPEDSPTVAQPIPSSPRGGVPTERPSDAPRSPRGGVPAEQRHDSDEVATNGAAVEPTVGSLQRVGQDGNPFTPRLNPRYVFEEFVVGESNRFAHATGIAASDPKRKDCNPLFIYGGSGLGKTHLMQAIGHRMHAIDPSLRIVYVTTEHFLNQFIAATQKGDSLPFRQAYRNVDLLLIDDMQFLMGKDRTQQEFFHTFNALYDAGKKVVMTSDRPPRDLSALEERLRSRFSWGLLVDIQPPDLETRVAILRKKAEVEGIRLPNDVMFFIAEHVKENIREMEGALKRLRMAASLHGRPVDLETARETLGHLMVGQPQPRVSIEDVQRAVAQYFSLRLADLLGTNRSKKFALPRHVAQYLCRKLTDYSFPDIAQKFGGKDHTSIIYACRKIESAMQKDPNLQGIIAHLQKQVTKGGDA